MIQNYQDYTNSEENIYDKTCRKPNVYNLLKKEIQKALTVQKKVEHCKGGVRMMDWQLK